MMMMKSRVSGLARRPARGIANAMICAVAILTMFATTASLSAKDFAPFGAGGDRQDTDRCPDKQFLTGLTVKSGLWVDQIALVCSPLDSNGSTGAVWLGPARGGNGGGAPVRTTCAPNEVILGVGLQMTPENRQVRSFRFNCGIMKPPGGRHDILLGNPPASRPCTPAPRRSCPPQDVRQDCPADQAVAGIKVNSGAHVNAIGLLCGRRPQLIPQPRR